MRAEDDLLEAHLDADQRVLAALATRARAAPGLARSEERLEDVAEPAEALAASAAEAALAAEVVLLALPRVGEHVVGVRDHLEPFGCLGAGFTSGCSSRASRRYAFLISSGVASRETPRTS